MAVAETGGSVGARGRGRRAASRTTRSKAAAKTIGDESGETLGLERRGGERTRTRGRGMATFVEPAGRLWLTRVTLVDRSEGGLGVRCPVPVAPGSSFWLDGVEGAERGEVAHSRGRGGAYRLGLRCGRRLAAA